MLKLDGPPTFKAKKFTVDEFQGMVGYIDKSVRYVYFSTVQLDFILIYGICSYDTLRVTSDVNVRWNPETGEFKVSGSYGR